MAFFHPFAAGFKRLTYVRDVEESKKLNGRREPMVVISASGMCEAGRVLHHLRNNIGESRNTVLLTGYQAENTLGRKLLTLHLQSPLAIIPPALADWPLVLKAGGSELEYTFDVDEQSQRVPALLRHLEELGIAYLDLNTRQSSLEEIFISLVSDRPQVAA